MADTKQGRDKQAHDETKRQQEREIRDAQARADETEPPQAGEPEGCYRRNCEEPAAFVVVERYQEETGHGLVEARAELCADHAAEERPANLDAADADYIFRVEPLATGE
jgi:hypothetical protein